MTDRSQIAVASRTPASALAYALLTGDRHPSLFFACQRDWLCTTLWNLLVADDHSAFARSMAADLKTSLAHCAVQPGPDSEPKSLGNFVNCGGALLPMESLSVLGTSLEGYSRDVVSAFSDFTPMRVVQGVDIGTLLELGWARDSDGTTFAETDDLSELADTWSADEHVFPVYSCEGSEGIKFDLSPAAVGAALTALGLPIESARWHYFTWMSQSSRPTERAAFHLNNDSPALADAMALCSLWASHELKHEVFAACGRREILALGAFLKAGEVPEYAPGVTYGVDDDSAYAVKCEFWRVPTWEDQQSL